MDTLDTQKGQKGAPKFECEYCDLTWFTQYKYNRHILTAKHKKMVDGYIMDTKKGKKGEKEQKDDTKKFVCVCGNSYKYSQGLTKHKKKCDEFAAGPNIEKNDSETLTNLVMTMMKQNEELTNKIIDLSKNNQTITNNTNNNNTINNTINNKTFNLNIFLNETCKDAMNITDFIESIQLQLTDLMKVGELGYVEGISNIITTNLKALDVTQRPVHCTDKKREILYIKDENKWEKDNEDKSKLRKVIKKVASKNQGILPLFKEKYPDCNKSVSRFSDQYNQIIIESMGGVGENDLEKEDKIIKNISKNVFIDKPI